MSGAKHKAPPCFPDDETLFAWRNINHAVEESAPSGYCTDCTPDYQARMCAEKRCKFPETSFVPVAFGGVEGMRRVS